MVKAILLELYLEEASRKGLGQGGTRDRSYPWSTALLIRAVEESHRTRGARATNPLKGGPITTIGLVKELRDHLRRELKLLYGDRALVVLGQSKRAQEGGPDRGRGAGVVLTKPFGKGYGYRNYTSSSKVGAKEIPKRLVKLADFCKKNPNAVVPDDL